MRSVLLVLLALLAFPASAHARAPVDGNPADRLVNLPLDREGGDPASAASAASTSTRPPRTSTTSIWA